MRRAVAEYIERGGRTLAECGGMMYLCQTIRDEAGRPHAMCGVLPLTATMEGMRLHLGLREIRYDSQSMRGHEFHYSRIEGEYPSAAQQYSARGEAGRDAGLSLQGTLGELHASLLVRNRPAETIRIMGKIYTRTGDDGTTEASTAANGWPKTTRASKQTVHSTN